MFFKLYSVYKCEKLFGFDVRVRIFNFLPSFLFVPSKETFVVICEVEIAIGFCKSFGM